MRPRPSGVAAAAVVFQSPSETPAAGLPIVADVAAGDTDRDSAAFAAYRFIATHREATAAFMADVDSMAAVAFTAADVGSTAVVATAGKP